MGSSCHEAFYYSHYFDDLSILDPTSIILVDHFQRDNGDLLPYHLLMQYCSFSCFDRSPYVSNASVTASICFFLFHNLISVLDIQVVMSNRKIGDAPCLFPFAFEEKKISLMFLWISKQDAIFSIVPHRHLHDHGR
jgi:hypothetical protein